VNDKLSLRAKFIIPLVILIAILLFFGTVLFYLHYHEQHILKKLYERIEHSRFLTDTLHHLQKERGLTTGYLLDSDDVFHKNLVIQRKITDESIKKLLEETHNRARYFSASERKTIDKIPLALEKLRKAVEKGDIVYDDAIEAYAKINRFLIRQVEHIIDISDVPALTRKLMTYIHLLYLKEYRGIERAKGVYLFIRKAYDVNELLDFYDAIARQKEHRNNLLAFLDDETSALVTPLLRNDENDETLQKMRRKLFQKHFDYLAKTDAMSWFTVLSKSIENLHKLSESIKEILLQDIITLMRSHESRFVIITAISLMSFFIFVLMIIAFLRLYKEEQKLRNVFEKYIISSVTDLKGRITNVSQAFCDISGYEKEELIGKAHNIVRHPDMPKEAFREMWDNLKRGKSWSGKIKNRKKDGDFYWVYAHIEPLYDNKGNMEAYMAVRLDITESEKLHQEVIQKEKENKAAYEMMLHQSRLAQMGELLSMIAHQWRQPLNTIAVTLSALKLKAERNKADANDIARAVERSTELIAHLNQTIEDFRNFFKPDKSKTLTTFTKLFDSMQRIIGKTLEAKGIDLKLEIKDDSEFICFENEMVQVLLNIVKNAEDALMEKQPQNPFIRIRAEDFMITIEDNAGGIPENILPYIYDPYFSTKMQKDGTGLGLYMSKLIVEEHCGGKIEVVNSRNGACFSIDLRHLKQTDTCNLLPAHNDTKEEKS
jgi:PAS domain S-box-containing protein